MTLKQVTERKLKRDDIATCFLILKGTTNKFNENIPSRIFFSVKTIHMDRFHYLIDILEKQGLMRIEHNVRTTGSRNKFYITTKGQLFIENYTKIIVMLGFEDRFPDIWNWLDFK